MPGPLVGLLAQAAVPVVGGLISRAFSGGGRRPRQANPEWLRGAENATRRLGARANAAEDTYWQRLSSFDPMAAATEASTAQLSLAMPRIMEAFGNMRGAQTATGRLNTGYGYADQDRFMADTAENLNAQMAARAMQAAQMRQAATSEMGRYATGARDTYMDAALGRYYSDADRRAADDASRRGMWGNIIGGAIPQVMSAVGNWANPAPAPVEIDWNEVYGNLPYMR